MFRLPGRPKGSKDGPRPPGAPRGRSMKTRPINRDETDGEISDDNDADDEYDHCYGDFTTD